METSKLTEKIVGAAMKSRPAMGPGLLGSACQACLSRGVEYQGLAVATEVVLPFNCEGKIKDAGCRIDLLAAGEVAVGLKSAERILPIHGAQRITHLKRGGRKIGLLISFNVLHLRDGIIRRAH